MFRQMCWLPALGSNGEKVLHLRTSPSQPWQHYTAFPQYAVPDYKIPKGSKGWATYQKLIKANWTLIPSDQVEGKSLQLEQHIVEKIAS